MLQLVVAVFNHDFYFDAASRGQQDLPDLVLQSQNIRGLIEEEMTVAKHDISSGFERSSSWLFFDHFSLSNAMRVKSSPSDPYVFWAIN
jgi:hypothetical protein